MLSAETAGSRSSSGPAAGRRRRDSAAAAAGWLACLAVVSATAARAAEPVAGRVVFEEEQPTFRAGDVVNLRWTPLPPGAEEFEILLSVDGGRHFVRLTEMEDPGQLSVEWRVPNLPSRDARLRLRIGLNEKEVELDTSAPFVIVGDDNAPVAGVRFRAGELWTSQTASAALPELEGLQRRVDSPLPPEWGAHLASSLARDDLAKTPVAAAEYVQSAYAEQAASENPGSPGRSPRVVPLRE